MLIAAQPGTATLELPPGTTVDAVTLAGQTLPYKVQASRLEVPWSRPQSGASLHIAWHCPADSMGLDLPLPRGPGMDSGAARGRLHRRGRDGGLLRGSPPPPAGWRWRRQLRTTLDRRTTLHSGVPARQPAARFAAAGRCRNRTPGVAGEVDSAELAEATALRERGGACMV